MHRMERSPTGQKEGKGGVVGGEGGRGGSGFVTYRPDFTSYYDWLIVARQVIPEVIIKLWSLFTRYDRRTVLEINQMDRRSEGKTREGEKTRKRQKERWTTQQILCALLVSRSDFSKLTCDEKRELDSICHVHAML